MVLKNYYKENYVSVWVGKCENNDLYNEYIEKHYDREDDESTFELGNDFGIDTYDDTYTLVYFSKNDTSELAVLLDVGEPDYVIEEFQKKYGRNLDEKYNCTVMIYDLNYKGDVIVNKNNKYGEFRFLGSVESNKFDML